MACHDHPVISQKHLGDDESVVLAMRQHLKALLGPALIFLFVCAAGGFLLALVPTGDAQPWLRLALGVVASAVLGRWVLWPFLNWFTSKYVVTNERILTQHGVLRRYGRTMPLSRVNDVSFDHGLIDRMLGCGTLVVSSAGELGQLILDDVPRVERVQREIYRLVEDERDRSRAAVPGPRRDDHDDHDYHDDPR